MIPNVVDGPSGPIASCRQDSESAQVDPAAWVGNLYRLNGDGSRAGEAEREVIEGVRSVCARAVSAEPAAALRNLQARRGAAAAADKQSN